MTEPKAPSVAHAVALERARKSLIYITPDARAGKPPCGECYLQKDETCDICGAKEGAPA